MRHTFPEFFPGVCRNFNKAIPLVIREGRQEDNFLIRNVFQRKKSGFHSRKGILGRKYDQINIRKGLARAWTTRVLDVTHLVSGAFLTEHGNRPLSKFYNENSFGSGLGKHDDRREERTHARLAVIVKSARRICKTTPHNVYCTDSSSCPDFVASRSTVEKTQTQG